MDFSKPKERIASLKFALLAFVCQSILLVLFGIFTEYGVQGQVQNNTGFGDAGVAFYYTMYTDIHVMMYFGFGFLLVYPRLYSWTSVCFCFFVGAFVFQWALLNIGFFDEAHYGHFHAPVHRIQLDMKG
jgi:hypothetical protein